MLEGRNLGEWGVFNLLSVAIRAVPHDLERSPRAHSPSPKTLRHAGGTKSFRHSPPVHADPFP